MPVMAHRPWNTIGASVTGSRHLRAGQPNQDALCHGELPAGTGVFAALSDGHGSKTCFRSDYGAQRAVLLVREALQSQEAVKDLQRPQGPEALAERLVARWRQEMLRHLKQHPFQPEETDGLEKPQRAVLGRNALVAYGATLLAAVAMAQEVILLQLGDGDFLYLEEDGAVKAALEPDQRHLGNATTSLCLPDALEAFRYRRWQGSVPRMVLGSTDGYGNSFRSETGFMKALQDYALLMEAHGWQSVSDRLPQWLSETSHQGSGDDISLALLFRR